MVARVELLLGVEMRRCSAGTFHHVGNRILRRYGAAIGLSLDFGILDPEDARTLLSAVVAGVRPADPDRAPLPAAQGAGQPDQPGRQHPQAAAAGGRGARPAPARLRAVMVEEVAVRFAERKPAHEQRDFDDLLIHWLRLLEDPRLSEVAALVRSA